MDASLDRPRSLPSAHSSLTTAVIAIVGIWVAALLIAVLSPDLVSGSEQDHIPIGTFTIWFYAALSTAFFMLGVAVHGRGAGIAPISPALGWIVASMWLVVAAAAIFAPVMETGTDPTRIPMAVLVAPMVGSIATAFVAIFAAGGGREFPEAGSVT